MSRIGHITILVGAAAALFAPAALAERPDDRAGLHGPGAHTEVTAVSARPDDRAGVRGPGAPSLVLAASVRPDDRAGVRGPGAAPTVLLTQPGTGFDWTDAGIGALGAFGLALVLFGGLQVASRTRRSHVPA
jgi:hypothetical protein